MIDPQTANRRRGILISKAEVQNQGGKFESVQALFDTCAGRPVVERDSRFILEGRAKSRALRKKLYYTEDARLWNAVKKGAAASIKTLHATKPLTEDDLAVVCVRLNGHVIHAIAVIAERGSLPAGNDLIVDADTLRACKVDVTKLLEEQKPPNSRSKEPREWEGFIEGSRTDLRSSSDEPTWSWYTDLTSDIFLSEVKCKDILVNNPEIFTPKKYNADMVEINSDTATLPKADQARLRELVAEFRDIFAGKNTLPKPMVDQPPVHFVAKEGAEPSRCPKPRWGPSQERLLNRWTRSALASGLIKPAGPNCPYANRPHVVAKPHHDARVTGDFVRLNETLVKIPCNLPNMEDELRKHRGAKFFTVSDASQGYYQLVLDQESSEMCALWTPLGLMVPTRLWMGPKNAGSLYQAAVSAAMGTLPEEAKANTSNYMDDFLTSGSDFESYFKNTRELFKMCRAKGITLNPAKTKLGFASAKLLGREISGDKIYIHGDNLRALRDCHAPRNVPQLKSFLGICAYARKHVKNFALHAERLHNLTRKGVPWHWPQEVEETYQRLKSLVLQNFKLHVPDLNKPFYLFTDASDVGMGAHLCQLRHPVKDSELHTVKDEDKLTIAFYSSSFDAAMQQKPVYYREARAMLWGLEKAKEFLEKAHLETVVVTDHAPLQWIKSTKKGAVSAWLIESLADPDYRVVYMPGPNNTTADSLSRPPMVSPSELTSLGVTEAWDAMLKFLPERHMHSARVHVWAAQHTALIQRKVQGWRHPTNAINVRAPKSMLSHCDKFNLILSAPAAEEAPVVAHQILKRLIDAGSDATFACLIPTELISYIPSAGGSPKPEIELRTEIRRRIQEEATKIVFAQTNFTWLIFDKAEQGADKVITNFWMLCNQGGKSVTDTASFSNPTQSNEITLGTEDTTCESVDTHTESSWIYPVWEVAGEEKGEESEDSSDAKIHGNFARSDLPAWISGQEADASIIESTYGENVVKRTSDGLILIATDEGNKVYVPQGKRQSLVMKTHRDMAHGMIRRVRKVLTKKYIWPKMISDMLSWIAECHECPLAKAKRNIKHNLYSPADHRKPRSAYGVDYYGIAKSKRGSVGVLTVTDLFTRWVNFIPVKDTTAETFAQALLERVVFERGAFKTLVSDGANAFVGEVATQLAQLLKIDKVETFHYPQGNSTTERHHILLGEFLRLLPADKRDSWDTEIGAAAYAANMCENSSTGFSPFELDCGFQPSAPADLMFQSQPIPTFETETFAKTSQEQKEWIQRIKDMHKIARDCDQLAKEISIQRLINPNRSPTRFEAGDRVLMYIPPQPQKGENAWKSKHISHWRRATVIKPTSDSGTTYLVKDGKGRTFTRSISLLNKDNSTDEVEEESKDQEVEETFYEEGAIIAIRGSAKDTFEVAQVLKVSENGDIQVKHFGTIEKQQAKATFKPAWADENERIVLSQKPPSSRYRALTGTINPSRVIQEITLTDSHKLSDESAKELYSQKKLQRNILKTVVVSKRDRELDAELSQEVQSSPQEDLSYQEKLDQAMQRWRAYKRQKI